MNDRILSRAVLITLITAIAISIWVLGGRDQWVTGLAIIGLSLAVSGAMYLNMRSNTPLDIPPLGIAAGLFVLMAFIHNLAGDHSSIGRTALLRLLAYLLAFAAGYYYINTQKRSTRIIILLAGLGALVTFYGLIIFMHDVYTEGIRNASLNGTFVNKNHYAGLMEMLIPLTASLLFLPLNKAQKTVVLYPLVLMIAGLGFSMSRGGWISITGAIAVYLGLLLPFSQGRKRWISVSMVAVIVILCVSLFLIIGIAPLQNKVETTVNDKYLGMKGRILIWESSFKAIKNHPLGYGPGSFQYAYQAVRPRGMLQRVHFAHNDYIHTAFELGVIGLFFLIYLIERAFNFMFNAYFRCKRRLTELAEEDTNERQNLTAHTGLIMAAIAGLTAISIHAVVEFNLHLPANGIIFSLILGMAMRSVRTVQKALPEPDKEKQPAKQES